MAFPKSYHPRPPFYMGRGGPPHGLAGGRGIPRRDDPYAAMHIGAPSDVVYRLAEAASRPGHPLNLECLQRGIPPWMIYDYIMQEKAKADEQGAPCHWDEVLEKVGGLEAGGPAYGGGHAGSHRQSGLGRDGGSAWIGGPRGRGPRRGGRGRIHDSHKPSETGGGGPRPPGLTQRQKQARDQRRRYKNGVDAKIAMEGGLG
ncbi:MAG: hypothetical protein Q9196_001615 [Gyalolechia fulgens]